jgi:hypothetical protein
LDQTKDDVAKFLKGAGYNAEEVGNFFYEVKEYSEVTVAKLLAGANYSIYSVGNFFKDELNKHAYDVMVLLHKAEFTFTEIATFMTAAYDLTTEEIEGLWLTLMTFLR